MIRKIKGRMNADGSLTLSVRVPKTTVVSVYRDSANGPKLIGHFKMPMRKRAR